MKFIVIGLGSMGKRRIRCLKALGHSEIIGFDLRDDRRKEVEEKYNVKTVAQLSEINVAQYDALIISTPPNHHTEYAKIAVDHNKPAFIEASVVLEDVKELQKYNNKNIFLAPSCTLRFYGVIKEIRKIIHDKKYGKVTNFSYHSGQYLPDWHPWEDINSFYVSNRITGGAREIVPFELTWISDVFGFPKNAKGLFRKTMDLGANIEDSYAFSLEFSNFIGNVIVDVTSRYATRNLIINLELAQIRWNWDDGYFKIYDAKTSKWTQYSQPKAEAAEGYNENIDEKMYIEEVNSFINGIKNTKLFPNSMADDIKILEILEQIEQSDGGFNK